MNNTDRATSVDVLSAWVEDARARTLQLVSDLDDEQLMGPRLPTINPLLWEIAHAAWFQERWVLQHAAEQKPIRTDGAGLFDSIAIDHDLRWDLPLPTRQETIRYLEQVRDAVCELLDRSPPSGELIYFVKLSVFHEDMHTEAFTYTRQTLAYEAPNFDVAPEAPHVRPNGGVSVDVELAGGMTRLGAAREAAFAFDNEKWAHPVHVDPFSIAATAVTQGQFAAFVDDAGYSRRELWSEAGWQWRMQYGAQHPVYWKQEGNGWLRRHFDEWRPLEAELAMIHVNWFEADAFCRWSGRRLPSEAEWELAASGVADKTHYPWGEEPPSAAHANLDWQAQGSVAATAHPAGDSRCGTRQMIGNVWEWTATTFQPFPGFVADPYKEYSQPCFGQCKVLRGGCWATRSRLIRNTWRNFYHPDRRDVFAGFRTCAK